MTEVISVRFRGGCKTYYFDPRGVQVTAGEHVIVETAQGLEYAQCAEGNHEVPDEQVVEPLRPMVRIATDHDRRGAGAQPGRREGGLRRVPEEDRSSTSWR